MLPKLLVERARTQRAIRHFFESRGFLEVETPTIVPSPGMDLHLDAFALAAPSVQQATEAGALWLITSPEYQMKRLLAEGHELPCPTDPSLRSGVRLERIFQICRCFRRGELGTQHNPEFTMVEWYRAPGDVLDVMRDTEELVSEVCGGGVRIAEQRVDVMPPILRMTVCEAFERFAGVAEADVLAWAEHDEDRYFRTLVLHVEPALARLDRGVFLVDYPASQASLARRKPTDPRFCERFELYVAGLELCNGFGELTDPAEQRARFVRDQAERARRGLPVYPIDDKLMAALERGLPACAGNALGVDRLAALAAGTTDIRRVLAFSADEV